MRVGLQWLSDHVDLGGLSAEALAELLTLHVAEAEAVEAAGGGWRGIHAARVIAVAPHPNADRLRLARLQTAAGEAEVVCGAPNIAAGQMVCFAPVGTTLPGGIVLERRRIRGVESGGMALSARELGIGDDHDGIVVLDETVAIGTPVSEILGEGASVEIDNTAITSRPDLWGCHGVAREVAAVLRRAHRPLDLGDAARLWALPDAQVEVEVLAPDLCPRYAGWVIGGIEIGPSPDWLRRRLESVGQRSINNVVDLTNYVMLECGQPLHAFDRRRVSKARIVVRPARPGERVVTLDGVERALPEGACVIADPERALAVAGVMGLESSEVVADTTEIVLEAATFSMASVRRTAKELGLRTDSAMRFEKGLAPESVPLAAQRFVKLLLDVCPGARVLGGARDVSVPPAPPRVVECAAGFLGRRLGLDLDDAAAAEILGRLGFTVERSADRLRATVPWWRAERDVAIPEDLVEDVGRIHGYSAIAPVPLRGALEPVPEEPERVLRRRVRRLLSGAAGFSEVHTYPFVTADECRRAGLEPGGIAVANAEQKGLDLLAPSLLPNLLRAAGRGLRFRPEVALYVTAPVWRRLEGVTEERERLALVLARREGEAVLDVKGVVEALLDDLRLSAVRVEQKPGPGWAHPGRCARLCRARDEIGWLAQLRPDVARAFDLPAGAAAADLDLRVLVSLKPSAEKMAPISRYPAVPFDVAVVVDRKTPAADVAEALRRVDPQLVRSVDLFDAYEGPNLPAGKRSLAFRVVFGSLERTLDTEDADRLRGAAEQALLRRGWSVRK